jgi:phage terminase large subunit-like protein
MLTKMKTKQQLKLEIEKLQKQLAELENQITFRKITFRKFKCLPDIEVSEIIKHENKTFKEISIPKGCRLIKIWEFAKLIESDESDEFLGEFKGLYNYFFLEQTKYAKANNYLFRACLNCDGIWFAHVGLANSNGNGRVVFCREKKC